MKSNYLAFMRVGAHDVKDSVARNSPANVMFAGLFGFWHVDKVQPDNIAAMLGYRTTPVFALLHCI